MVDADAAIHAPGPWAHRDVAANGARFHLVEAGAGPLVLLLHGFPTFWWTWRQQIPALAAAGYRVAAMDLRGYGGSDHPPEGYDPRTLAADVAGVVRCLGSSEVVLVGHGWGGLVAWTAAVLSPQTVRAIATVSIPHPRQLRRAIVRDRRQRRALRYAVGFQVPFWPERSLTARDGRRVSDLMAAWSADDSWLADDVGATYRAAFCRWPTAHTAVEYHRWGARSSIRPDGLSYLALMEAPVRCPVLQVHGRLDPMILPAVDDTSGQYVHGPLDRVDLATGHFPHEEDPAGFTSALADWLAGLP